MPDQPESQQTAVTPQAQPDQPQSQTPQQESREALYQKLYGTQQQEQQVASPQQIPPSEVVDYKAQYESLAAQVQQLIAKQAAPPQPTAPPTPAEDWFSLLQSGKRTEAEQVLKDYIAQGASQKIIQETLVQAMELNRMEREIEDYNNSVRATNPDMLDVEDLISLKAEKEFNALLPTVKNNKDYVNAYKTAVGKAVDSMRTVLRRQRAAAKNEAMTTRRDVLASTTIAPNDITNRQETGPSPNEQSESQLQSPTDYLAARQAAYRKVTGV